LMTLIDDTYNANPLSMQLAFDTLADASPGQRRIAIVGNMAELGADAARYHQQVGAYGRFRADVLIGVGELAKHYRADWWFDSADACLEQLENILRPGDRILVKGSNSSGLSRIASWLREHGSASGPATR